MFFLPSAAIIPRHCITGSQRNLSQYLNIKSGETKVLKVLANIDTNASADTYQVGIGNMYASGCLRLISWTTCQAAATGATGNTLTVQSTGLTFTKDTSLGNKTLLAAASA